MALLRKTTAAKVLDLSKSGLEKLVASDPAFPKPIKMGEHRQSAVFFDEGEINAWINTKKAQRVHLVEVA
jgi:prophage regulatory protein